LILFSHTATPRLQYIAEFIGKELKAERVTLTSSLEEYNRYAGIKINYTNKKVSEKEIWIAPHTLLFETTIQQQPVECFEVNANKAFFKTGGNMDFDIFAASFYLLTRYEEYLPHSKDMYGRYAYENSIAYKESFLTLPLVNIWVQQLRQLVEARFPGSVAKSLDFTFLPTYDIDIAWSYKHKGFWRNFGGVLRSTSKGQLNDVMERINVLRGSHQDPFDAYNWLNELHEQYNVKPYYFFLVPKSRGRYDKNIPPSNKEMQDLIRAHANRYPVGLHPSWKSGDDHARLKEEVETLANVTRIPVVASRQHYIRFTLPSTFRRLIENSIRFDFSMGYGSINGFRASTASTFYWYDLEKEQKTDLLLFPFCYMEANSFYEQKQTAQQALDEMRYYYSTTKSVNGHFIMIWHNSFLGTDPLYKGWRDIYQQFIKEVCG
jgi:hypothetical protein